MSSNLMSRPSRGCKGGTLIWDENINGKPYSPKHPIGELHAPKVDASNLQA